MPWIIDEEFGGGSGNVVRPGKEYDMDDVDFVGGAPQLPEIYTSSKITKTN